jgi:hypothetical protein
VSNCRLSLNERFVQLALLFARYLIGYHFPPTSELGTWQRNLVLRCQDPFNFDLLFGHPAEDSSLQLPSGTGLKTIREGDYSQLKSLMGTLVFNNTERRLFVTSRGYMGLHTPRVENDDYICVFPGCNVPVIMRKVDRHYVHLGECYVHGIMDGEVMDALDAGIVSLEELEIH